MHKSDRENERKADKKQLADLQAEMKQNQSEWQKNLEEYNANNLALAKKLDEVSKEAQQGMNNLANQLNAVLQEKVRIQISYDVLMEEKKKLDQNYVTLMNLKAEVDNKLYDLQRQRDELQQKKNDLETTREKLIAEKKILERNNAALSMRRKVFMEKIEQMIRTLLVKGGQIASINTSHREHTVRTKLYQRNGWFLALPGSGFSVAEEYDQLATNISKLIGNMVSSLSRLQEEGRTDITVTEEVTVSVTGDYSQSNS
jgi:DNA repair exonuclease SbcCD ATPase subunit